MDLRPNESKINVYENVWGRNLMILMKHLIEESMGHRKFGCLPNVHSNYPCQIGELISERFS